MCMVCKLWLYVFCDIVKLPIFCQDNNRSNDNDTQDNSFLIQKDHCLPSEARAPGSW